MKSYWVEGAGFSTKMGFPENSFCIKCDKGGKLLLCSENGCPLALHELCLGFPARLDDAGRFCCPYCLYKKAVVELHKAREYASAKKKDLLIFMDGDVISSEKDMGEIKTCEDNGHNQIRNIDTNICSDYGKSKYNNDGIIDQPSRRGEVEKTSNAEKDSEASAGSKSQGPLSKVNGENGNNIAEEKQVQEESHESSSEEQIQEEENETSVEGEKTEGKECEIPSSSTDHNSSPIVCTRAKRGCKSSKPADKDSEVVPVQSKLAEEQVQEEESETSSSSTDPDTSPDSSPVVPRAKRGCIRSKPVDKDSEAVPIQSKLAGKQIQEEEHETSVEEETIQEDEYEPSSSSTDHDSSYVARTRAKRGCKRSEPADKDSEAVPVQRKLLKQHDEKQVSPAATPTWRCVRKSSLDKRTGKVFKKELKSSRRARAYGDGIYAAIKWTEEEEKVLWEAVKIHLEKPNPKIPWKDILEENRDKFHKTRTPGALKYKWRREVSGISR